VTYPPAAFVICVIFYKLLKAATQCPNEKPCICFPLLIAFNVASFFKILLHVQNCEYN
jgi:hypothetical protein